MHRAGEHISLNPVSKVDGILAKIFIYNILQQRLDRLLLAVLRRKRGRSVHEWGCRLGWGSAGGVQGGRSWGPGKQEKTSKRQKEKTPPTAGSYRLHWWHGGRLKCCLPRSTWDFFFFFWKRMAVVFKNEDNLNSKSVPNEVPFIRPCASEIPPWSLSENTVIQVAKCNDMLLPSAYYSSHVWQQEHKIDTYS